MTLDGQLHTRQCAEPARHAPCIFEYVYLARPDSMIEDVSVYKARLRMGEKLGEKILREFPGHDIDAVIPIPDTSRTAAGPLAQALGVPVREGFVKNRYIGRTFIMPGQSERVKSVRRKLNAISLEFRKKNVLLVDDSIVRGTTSKQIIQMARDAGRGECRGAQRGVVAGGPARLARRRRGCAQAAPRWLLAASERANSSSLK
jgi:amidophosphoribosyltransferase